MKGAKLSPFAVVALQEIIKARKLTQWCKDYNINPETAKKLAAGAYTFHEIVSRAESAFVPIVTAEAVLAHVTSHYKLPPSFINVIPDNKHPRYFAGGMPPIEILARWVCAFIMYKEVSKSTYRSIAAHLGYKLHVSVKEACSNVFNLMDTNPSFRREVLTLQLEISELGLPQECKRRDERGKFKRAA